MAGYASAVEAATGRAVDRCVLVLVGGEDPVDLVLDGDRLVSARARAEAVAGELCDGR